MKVISKTHQPLTHRTEVVMEAEAEVTPKNSEFVAFAAKEAKKPEDHVVMQTVETHFGSHAARAAAFVYDSKEAKETYEQKTKHIKEAEKKAAEEAQKAREEAKAAKKAAEEAAKAAPEEAQ